MTIKFKKMLSTVERIRMIQQFSQLGSRLL